MPRDKVGGGWLAADDVHDVLAVEVARLTQECLFALVVVFGAVVEVPRNPAVGPIGVALRAQHHVLGIADSPAGKGARRLFDVVFAVAAHAHAEQLQQFAPVVFVDSALVIIVIVQPHNHSGIFGKLHKQRLEIAHPVAAEHSDLVPQHFAVNDFRVAGGEDVVPEQAHLFLQRRGGCDHAIEPVFAGGARPHHS